MRTYDYTTFRKYSTLLTSELMVLESSILTVVRVECGCHRMGLPVVSQVRGWGGLNPRWVHQVGAVCGLALGLVVWRRKVFLGV